MNLPTAPSPRLRNYLPPLVFAVLTLIVYADVLFDGSRMPAADHTDLAMQFVSWRDFGFGQLAAGHVPLWNPHIYSGTPYMASFQSALFYPINWLHLVMPLGLAISWYCALHTMLMGYFASLWARYRGMTLGGQILAGVMMMFSGQFFLHLYAGHLPHLAVMAWTPLVFLAADAMADGKSWRWGLVGAAAVAMQILGGHPQYVFYTALTLGIYLLVRLFFTRHRARLLVGLAAFYLAGALLSSIQLIPGIEASRENVLTSGLAYAMASQFSVAPEQFLTFLAPYAYGTEQPMQIGGRSFPYFYFGHGYLWELCFFVSITGLVLAFLGLIKTNRANRWACLAAIVILGIISAGRYTPVHRWLCDYLPYFGSFRVPAKFMFFVSLLLAILAAEGLQVIELTATPRLRKITALALLGVAGVVIVGMLSLGLGSESKDGLWFSLIARFANSPDRFLFDPQQLVNPEFLAVALNTMLISLGVAVATLVVVATLIYLGGKWPRAGTALVLVATLELTIFALMGRGTMDQQLRYPIEWARELQDNPHLYRCIHLQGQYENLPMSLGAYEMWGYDPGVLRRYCLLISASQGRKPEIASQYIDYRNPIHFDGLYRMFRLHWLFAFNRQSPPQPMLARLSRPMEQVQLIGQYALAPERDAMFAALLDKSFDPTKVVYLEETPAIIPAGHPVAGKAEVISQNTDQLEIKASNSEPAILLVTDNYAEGWRIYPQPDDSQQNYQLLPANYCLRGIPLAAGEHHLLLKYLPTGWTIGKRVTYVSLLAYLVVLLFAVRQDAKNRA